MKIIRKKCTGIPCIKVPSTIPEKYSVMQNTNMQGVLYSAVQRMYSKMVQRKFFGDLFEKGSIAKQYYVRSRCNARNSCRMLKNC